MTKNAKVGIGVVIVIIIAAAIAIAATHKSNTPSNSGSTNTGSSSKTSSTPSVNNSIVQTKTDPTLGQYLADPAGKPLYTYNLDTANSNKSNCTGSCLSNWPAYIATATVANLPSGITVFKRADTGAMQYAYNGMPLYYFTGDSNGKVTGNGVENFQIAKPSASASSTNSSSSSNSSNSSSSSNPY